MSDPIQDIARQLGITTFGDGLLTKIRETIDLLQSDANNLMQYKEVAAELEADIAALKSAPVVMPERSNERGSDGKLTYEAKARNDCLDEVEHLNRSKTNEQRTTTLPVLR